MAKTPRRTITLNIPTDSPVLVAAERRAAEQRRPVSVTLREIADEAFAREAELRRALDDERFCHNGTRADLAGDTAQLRAARTENAQLKQSLANRDDIARALSAELDSANKEIERLQESFNTEHLRLKCSQEALAEAMAELATMHAARRAEAEAEDYAAEKARIDEAEVDRAVIIAALTTLRRRTDVLISRKRVEQDTEV